MVALVGCSEMLYSYVGLDEVTTLVMGVVGCGYTHRSYGMMPQPVVILPIR